MLQFHSIWRWMMFTQGLCQSNWAVKLVKHNNPFKYTFSLVFDTVTTLLVFYGNCVACFHISEWIILCSVSLLTPTGKARTLLGNNLSKRTAKHTLLSHYQSFYFGFKWQMNLSNNNKKRKEKLLNLCHWKSAWSVHDQSVCRNLYRMANSFFVCLVTNFRADANND